MSKILHFISILRTFFKGDKAKEFFKGLAAAGAGAGIFGIFKAHKANTVNKKALELRDNAVKLHAEKYDKIIFTLEELGRVKADAMDSMLTYSECIERIISKPDFKELNFKEMTLPTVTISEIKIISHNLEMALKGATSAVAGTCVGVAFSGLTPLAAGPGVFLAGIIICADGINLSKKSITNMKEATALSEEVNKIIEYYDRLEVECSKLKTSIVALLTKFDDYINILDGITYEKVNWSEYSRKERRIVETATLLCKELYHLCDLKLTTDANIPTVNKKDISTAISNANKALRRVK